MTRRMTESKNLHHRARAVKRPPPRCGSRKGRSAEDVRAAQRLLAGRSSSRGAKASGASAPRRRAVSGWFARTARAVVAARRAATVPQCPYIGSAAVPSHCVGGTSSWTRLLPRPDSDAGSRRAAPRLCQPRAVDPGPSSALRPEDRGPGWTGLWASSTSASSLFPVITIFT